MSIERWRKEIDAIDEQLVRLLNERARVACEIGRLKKELGVEVYQPEDGAWTWRAWPIAISAGKA